MENLVKKKGVNSILHQNIVNDSKEITMDSDLEDENFRQKIISKD